MFNQILKDIDKEVERCEDMMNAKTENALMDRIQGILWVRNLLNKHQHQPCFDVDEYYKEEYN